MPKDSGQVGAQKRGEGSGAGRGAEHTVRDNVDAGDARKYDLRHAVAVGEDPDQDNTEQVDQDNPLNGAAKVTGGLEKHDDSRSDGPDLTSVEGIRSGGYAAQDSPEEEPALATRTAQSSQADRT